LTAERFVLVDGAGGEKAVLELDDKGNPWLQLRNGAARAVLTTAGAALVLKGPDGKTGAYVGLDEKNTSRVELCSERMLDGVRLTTQADGSCGVYVLDPSGRTRGGFEAFSNGGTGISFHDAQGRIRGQLGLDPTRIPNLILLDENGARRLGMVVRED